MSELKINDSGTWRNVQQVQVNDSGTWRDIQQIYVNDGGTWRTVFLKALLDATMTEGSDIDPGDPSVYYYGYVQGGYGSMSSTSVAGGYTLTNLYDGWDGVSALIISGFGADTGQSFFTTCTVGGTSQSSSAASYSYVSGTAYWYWSGLFGLDGTGTSAVLIV